MRFTYFSQQPRAISTHRPISPIIQQQVAFQQPYTYYQLPKVYIPPSALIISSSPPGTTLQQRQRVNTQLNPKQFNILRGVPISDDEKLDKQFHQAVKRTQQLLNQFQQQQKQFRSTVKPHETKKKQELKKLNDSFGLREGDTSYRGQGILPQSRSGYGELRDQKGKLIYAGEWKNNLYDGFGTLHNTTMMKIEYPIDWNDLGQIGNAWKTYVGSFRNGKMDGSGKLTLTNGDVFDGQFKQGAINGKGFYKVYDGVSIRGEWQNGLLVQLFE